MSDEPKKKTSSYDPSRRKFLKGVGVAGAGAALADSLLNHDISAARSKLNAPGDPISGSVNIALDINGQKRNATVEPRTTLLSTMRDRLEPGITGPKLVCDMGTCGACTVLMTVEGLGTPENMNAVQQAFVAQDALMCGFCTPGFVTTISAYLKKNSNPTLDEVREACKGNFCRCGTYPRVFEAALTAAKAGS